jgi:hypothetical protein
VKTAALLALLVLTATGLAGCSGNSDAQTDSDQDGLLDSEEIAGWDVHAVMADGTTTTYHVSSDPNQADTSGQGLADVYKALFRLDPHKADTDGDGLTDCQEIRQRSLAGCQKGNTTSDSGYRTRADVADTDGDGIVDGVEVTTWHTDPLAVDSDHDGLPDGDELKFGGNPTASDTDGDGCKDGVDPFPGARQNAGPGLLEIRVASGSVHLDIRLADAGLRAPATGEWEASGAIQDAHPLEPPPVSPGSCGASPSHPWVAVDLQAVRADGRPLDLSSISNPGGVARAFWNERNGTFSWAITGTAPFNGPLHWSGADGEVTFAPRLFKGDNQNP